MKYELNDLLDSIATYKVVALHLIEGFKPIIECPDEGKDNLDYDRLPTAVLFSLAVPALTSENLTALQKEIAEEIKRTMGFRSEFDMVSRDGFHAYRFRRGSHDYDVFFFYNGEKKIIQFRQPNKQYEQLRA
jgi:hypothetical protein